MRKLVLIPGLAIMLVVFTSFISSPGKQDDKKKVEITASSIPDDVKTIFENSCMACHATGGRNLAMLKVNFSEWDEYTPAKQAKKAAAICKVLTKDAMPPKSYRESHPEVIPTAEQKDLICKWSKSMTAKNKNKSK
jgi:cytochrome c5